MAKTEDQSASSYNIIAAGTLIKGEISSNCDIRIDGNIEGTIFSKGKVVIGEKGSINGEIKAVNIDIMGSVKGNASAYDSLSLKATGTVTGDISTSTLIIEQGASFNGKCKMGKIATSQQPSLAEEKK